MIHIEIKESNKLKTEKNSAFISFPFDNNIVNEIRSYPFRYYIPENTCWEIPIDKVSTFIKNMQNHQIKIDGDLTVFNDKKEISIPKGFKFKTKPYEHQIDGVEYGLEHNRWFLGDEQGLGKTKQAIDIAVARKIAYGYKHCLIVCGVNTLKWNWVNEINTHSDEESWILGQKKNRDGLIKIGSTQDKVSDLLFIEQEIEDNKLPYFIITNVESFRDKQITDLVQKLCNKGIINMCVADEMHKMKNPQAQQTKGFFKCLPECRIGMTGTPLMNSPLDLYVILKWLGYESHAFYSFKQHYCVMGGYGGYEIVGYKNMEQLTAQVKEIMLRRLKDEVLDLPEKTYIDEYVEMTGRQEVLYKEVKSGIKSALANGEIDLNNPLSALIRLRQTTGYPGIISDTITESAKLDRMEDLVEEAVSSGQKIIIFSNWTQMTSAICDRLRNNYGIGLITGETPDSNRQTVVQMFQEGKLDVMVGTIGAMGTGLTLTAGTVVIFVDEPWNKALYDQAVDRAHRIGQKNNITVYNLITKGTVDERIHELVYKKGLFSDAIIDGKVVGNKTEIFNYLMS